MKVKLTGRSEAHGTFISPSVGMEFKRPTIAPIGRSAAAGTVNPPGVKAMTPLKLASPRGSSKVVRILDLALRAAFPSQVAASGFVAVVKQADAVGAKVDASTLSERPARPIKTARKANPIRLQWNREGRSSDMAVIPPWA